MIRVVFHLSERDRSRAAFNNISNLLAAMAGEPGELVLLVNGIAVTSLLEGGESEPEWAGLRQQGGRGRAYLVGTGTSVRAPSITACCNLTNATKGVSRKSTSPTRTLDASASRGSFFMNLFFSWSERGGKGGREGQIL